jgi:hypothetical protein
MPDPHLVCQSSPTSKTSFSRCWPVARKRADLQAHFRLDRWVEAVTTAVQLALAIRSDLQAVELVVGPLKGKLQNPKEVGEAHVRRNREARPYRGLDAAQIKTEV